MLKALLGLGGISQVAANADISKPAGSTSSGPVVIFTQRDTVVDFNPGTGIGLQVGTVDGRIVGTSVVNFQFTPVSQSEITFDNRAIITSLYFWKDEIKAPLSILKFDLPASANKSIGLTGMAYAPENDWLVLTFASEATGNSYLGIAENATHKMTRKKIKVDELIDFAEVDEKFKGNVVEAVCVQSEKTDQVKIHLKGADQIFRAFAFAVGAPRSGADIFDRTNDRRLPMAGNVCRSLPLRRHSLRALQAAVGEGSLFGRYLCTVRHCGRRTLDRIPLRRRRFPEKRSDR